MADFTHPNAQPFDLEAGDSALLLIHGFTGSPSHMRYIGDAVHAAGYSVRGILLPGHGETIQAMEESSREQWLDACRTAYQEMLKKYRRVSVGGLSMGGLLSLLLAEEFDPCALILFAPALQYKNAVNRLSPIAKHFIKVVKWGGHDYNPEEFLFDYDHGYEGSPVAKVEDMTYMQRVARQNLSRISCPTLVFQSHKDESVHRTVPDRIMRGVSSVVKEISWVDRSPHVLTIGPDRDYVCQRVIDFLGRYSV